MKMIISLHTKRMGDMMAAANMTCAVLHERGRPGSLCCHCIPVLSSSAVMAAPNPSPLNDQGEKHAYKAAGNVYLADTTKRHNFRHKVLQPVHCFQNNEHKVVL
jgi:hypothetical protein